MPEPIDKMQAENFEHLLLLLATDVVDGKWEEAKAIATKVKARLTAKQDLPVPGSTSGDKREDFGG